MKTDELVRRIRVIIERDPPTGLIGGVLSGCCSTVCRTLTPFYNTYHRSLNRAFDDGFCGAPINVKNRTEQQAYMLGVLSAELTKERETCDTRTDRTIREGGETRY